MNCKRIVLLWFLGVAVCLLNGCATPAPKETRRFFWPRLPERPRIEWIKNYTTERDFPKGGVTEFVANVIGEEDLIELRRPMDIVVNGKKRVFLADPGLNNVVIFDLLAQKVSLLTRTDKVDEKLDQPTSLALGEDETLYVGDMATKMISVFDADGKKKFSFDIQPNLTSVGGLAVDQKGRRLYVTDTRGHKVGIFDLQGKYISSFGARGEDDGQFNYPHPIRFNRKNELLVGDSMNARIQVFDTNGKFLRKFGSRGDAPQDLQVLKGIGVDSENNIYVTDGKAHKIVIYNNSGDFLLTFGGLYSSRASGKEAMGGFVLPQGIYIDKDDRIYVVDQLNHRFQVFQYISDKFLSENPIPGYKPNAVNEVKEK